MTGDRRLRRRTAGASGTRVSLAALLVLLVFAPVLAPAGLRGQPARRAHFFPTWADNWRPLAPDGNDPRPLLEPPEVGTLLLGPPPRVGAFWGAANPAAAPREIERSWTGFAAGRRRENGGYRRPMDPVDARDSGVRVLAWGPLDDWGAAAGQVAAGQVDLRPGSFADVVAPYETTPFVLTDTARVDFRRTYARLEGAIGARLGGGWAAGVAGAFRGVENRTRAAPVPRNGRRLTNAGRVGVMRDVAGEALRIGAYGTYRVRAEEMSLFTVTGEAQILALEGFRDPIPIDLREGDGHFRRMERTGWDAGLSADGRLGPLRWSAFGERGGLLEQQWDERLADEDDPALEWSTRSTRAGVAGLFRADRLLLHLDARWSDLSGDGRTPDFDDAFRTDIGKIGLGLEGRLLPGADEWSGVLRLGLEREDRRRFDPTAPALSDLTLWRQEAAFEVARRIGGGPTAALGYGIAVHDAGGAIPNPSDQGSIYQRMIAPEIALYSTRAVTNASAVTLRWPLGGGVDTWGQASYGSLSPGERPAVGTRFRPDGTRSNWTVSLGVVLRR